MDTDGNGTKGGHGRESRDFIREIREIREIRGRIRCGFGRLFLGGSLEPQDQEGNFLFAALPIRLVYRRRLKFSRYSCSYTNIKAPFRPRPSARFRIL